MSLHPQSPLMSHCPETLPSVAYLDPEWFARERRAIWAREWVYAGRLNDLAARHDAARDGRRREPDPLPRRRGYGDRLSQHLPPSRGGVVCRGGKADGQPHHLPLPCLGLCDRRAAGLGGPCDAGATTSARRITVFTRCMSATGTASSTSASPTIRPIFAPDLGVHALDNWPMADLVTGHRLETVLDCNWKIFWENYNECLHCPGIHPELSDMVPVYRKGIMSAQEAPDWTPEVPSEPVLKAGAGRWTMDGQPCGPEFPNLTAAGAGERAYLRHPVPDDVRRGACRLRARGQPDPAWPRANPADGRVAVPARDAGAAGLRPGPGDGFRHDRPAAGWRRLRDEPARAALLAPSSAGD